MTTMRATDSVPRTRTTLGMIFKVAGPVIWYSLQAALRSTTLSPLTFAQHLKAYLFSWSTARLETIYDVLYNLLIIIIISCIHDIKTLYCTSNNCLECARLAYLPKIQHATHALVTGRYLQNSNVAYVYK